MIKKPNKTPCLFSNLSDMPDQPHPLHQLADKIDWGKFETAFQPSYCQDNGRPDKPIRLMCGLPIFKYLRNLSDSSLQLQESHEGSLVFASKYLRDTVEEQYLAELDFLRDDYDNIHKRQKELDEAKQKFTIKMKNLL